MSDRRSPAAHAVGLTLVCAFCLQQPGSARAADDFECLIDARQTLEIRSPVEALVQQVHVQRGDTVRKGQLLVQMEAGAERAAVEAARRRAEARGAVDAARARVASTQRRAERAEDLLRQQFISTSSRDEVVTEHELAVAQLREAEDAQRIAITELQRAEEVLGLRTLRSPISGVVTERNVGPGELATLTSRLPLVKLAEIDPLLVRVVLPAAWYGRVAPAARATVVPEVAVPGGPLVATVRTIDRVVHSASGTFTVQLELPNPQRRVPAGVRCKLRFGD